MERLALLFLLIVPLIKGDASSDEGCVFTLNSDLATKYEPLFLKENENSELELLRPIAEGKNGYFQLAANEEVVVSCPGSKNNIAATKEQSSKATCVSGTTLLINGQNYEVSALNCASRVSATVINTGDSCANGEGTALQLGFEVEESWQKLIDICHDIEGSKTFYETHKVNGDVIEGKVIRTTGRPSFTRGEKWLFTDFTVDTSYKVATQTTVFKKILGKTQTAAYVSSKAFLARGHLAPDADFPLSPWQFLTYFYVNAAPQWQAINAGNWLKTETNTRTIAARLGVDLDVATGTYGVSKMIDDDGNEQEMYLEGDKLPVPENFWKVLHNPEDDSCIGIVATNNPYLTSSPEKLCSDVCEANNWPTYQDDLSKGYVYCCEYEDLKSAISFVPDFTCKSTLKFK